MQDNKILLYLSVHVIGTLVPLQNVLVCRCLLDCDSGSIAFKKNGQDLGVAFQVSNRLQGAALYPTFCLKNAELQVGLPLLFHCLHPPESLTHLTGST